MKRVLLAIAMLLAGEAVIVLVTPYRVTVFRVPTKNRIVALEATGSLIRDAGAEIVVQDRKGVDLGRLDLNCTYDMKYDVLRKVVSFDVSENGAHIVLPEKNPCHVSPGRHAVGGFEVEVDVK